ncbi:MAG: hypothetical protein RSD81_02225 [Pseudomonas sp.]
MIESLWELALPAIQAPPTTLHRSDLIAGKAGSHIDLCQAQIGKWQTVAPSRPSALCMKIKIKIKSGLARKVIALASPDLISKMRHYRRRP